MFFNGCAAVIDAYVDSHYQEKKTCAELFGEGTDKYRECVVTLISKSTPASQNSTNPERVRKIYRQERARDQILQHGAGGCTPNFSTGGCL